MSDDDPRLTKLVCTTCGHRKAALFVMRILYDREGPFCVPHGSPLYSCTGYWKDPNPWTAVPPRPTTSTDSEDKP